jgi:hypothetical protein
VDSGAPHRGFAVVIRLTRVLISALTGGRPSVGRRESRVLAEATLLPPQDSVRRHDDERLPPAGPDTRQPDPQQAIRGAELRSADRPPVDGELLAQGQVRADEVLANDRCRMEASAQRSKRRLSHYASSAGRSGLVTTS